MPMSKSSPYIADQYIIKQLGEHTIKITYCKCLRESGWEDEREHKDKCSVNTEKLSNNLSRTKSTVKELVMCNEWDYWCTFTIDKEKYDRYNLKAYIKDLSRFLLNYNRYCNDDEKVKYILIPEQHKDGAWHMHGFIKGIKEKDLYTNIHGYLTWKQYESKFGFISMSKLESKEKASSYMMKYMTKDIEKNVTGLNAHMYYASKGLKHATELYRGSALFKGEYDWEHPDGYCKVKTIDIRKTDIKDIIDYDV